MNKYAKVENHLNLVRDLNTNAIINIDTIELDNYNIAKRKKEQDQIKVGKIEDEIKELKSSIEEIKTLLKGILNGS